MTEDMEKLPFTVPEEEIPEESKESKSQRLQFFIIFGTFIALATIVGIVLTASEDSNKKTQEIDQLKDSLRYYQIDGSISHNNYLLSHKIRSAEGIGINVKDLTLEYNIIYYSLLQNYENPKINKLVNDVLTCYRDVQNLLDADANRLKINEVFGQCNKFIGELDESVYEEMNERY